jgi:hypothetical protein
MFDEMMVELVASPRHSPVGGFMHQLATGLRGFNQLAARGQESASMWLGNLVAPNRSLFNREYE